MRINKSVAVLSLVGICTAFAVYLVLGLSFSYDFEAFFPKDDPATSTYLEFRDKFETDNDFVIIAIENEKGIFDSTFMRKVSDLSDSLVHIESIEEVRSPTNLMEYYQDPFLGSVFEIPVIDPAMPEQFDADSSRIYQEGQWVGLFFSEDGKSIAINLKHTQKLSKEKCDALSQSLEAMVAKFKFDRTHLIGRAFGQRMYVELMMQELFLFISMSLVLTIIFLFIAFRSGWGIFIPTLIVLMSILWTLAFVRLIGNELDLMMTVLPTILFVVGMSDSVHVLTKYMQELRNGRDKKDAIKYAFKSIRLATFLTALTTSIGFLSLVFSNIEPISNFGLYTSVGVLLAYGLTFTILPAILLLARPQRLYTFAVSEDFWTAKLRRAYIALLRHRKWVLPCSLALLLLSAWGISTIKVDNLMLEDLRDTHLLKREFNYMETHFSGCRPFELKIDVPAGKDVFDPIVLNELAALDTYLRDQYQVGSVLSLPVVIGGANKALNAGDPAYNTVPDDPASLAKIKKFLNRKDFEPILNLLYHRDSNTLRVSGKLADVGRKHYEEQNAKLQQFVTNRFQSGMKAEVTGTAHLIDLNNKYLVDNMVLDLLLSVLAIGLVMGLVYRSWRMIILTIVPNLIPLFIVGGIMGFAGIPLKVSTSIIFNIAFGIAVDDTIHFLARVRTLLSEGLSVNYAVKRTFLTTGKAMIVTSLILSGGFLMLIFSDFLGTFYIGLLISMTLFIALIAELVVTPIVVMFFYKKRKKNDAPVKI
jgi:predicted RND superfamily exporter protein